MKNERDGVFKASKLVSILVVAMLISVVFSVIMPNVKPTTVTKTDVAAGYVDASQTYVLVMNFTITTEADILLNGTAPSVGQILENSNQHEDWGTVSPIISAYNNATGIPGGDYDWTVDSIWLDTVSDGKFIRGEDTVLNGSYPTNNEAVNGYAKVTGVWKRVKTYDKTEGGTWDPLNDAILFEGSDNNTAYLDELNALTLKLSACNATYSDISDVTLWNESGLAGGFQATGANKDIFIKNASYSAGTSSWNLTNLTHDINPTDRFYVAVNISASASHVHTIKMQIPPKEDGGTSGVYNYGDQGLFLAGTNDTGGITNLYNKTIDTFAPITEVNDVSTYWHTTQPLIITGTSTDNTSGVKNVTLCYRFSTNNITWGTWVNISNDVTPWPSPSWSFGFGNLTGFYQFYSRGQDNVTNYENAPADPGDAIAGYDINSPKATITTPENGDYYKTMNAISGSCNDTGSGIYSVNITIYNVSANKYWNSGSWQVGVHWIGTTLAGGYTSWSNDTSTVSWMNNTQYIVNATARDNATNVGATDHNSFRYDTYGPVVAVTFPEDNGNYKTMTQVYGTCDVSASGISTVNLTIYNVSANKYWTGTTWGAGVSWLHTNLSGSPYNAWANNTLAVTWMNGTSYYVNVTGTDNASNVGSTASNNFLYDTEAPYSDLGDIADYWQTESSVIITYTAGDNGSGLKNVTLYYRYTATNNTGWGAWTAWSDLSNPDTTPYITKQWTFDFPDDSGWYEFYSIAKDNATNSESAPAGNANDTRCGFDPDVPTGGITAPTNGAKYNAGNVVTNITGWASDPRGVIKINITIYNITNNKYWNDTSLLWQTTYHNLTLNTTTLGGTSVTWWFENTNTFPTWITTKSYKVNITATDSASNVNPLTTPAATASFTYDTNSPKATITRPQTGVWYGQMNSIYGPVNDTGTGVYSVNITIYNVSANKYWSGTTWGSSTWLSTDLAGNYTWWSYNSGTVAWFNGTTYYINATAKDNASNVGATDSNSFFYDVDDVSSQVDAIATYWHTSQPLAITGTASDSGSGVKNVTLWYKYRATNSSSWSTWVLFGTDLTPWPTPSWSFTFANKTGHYEFYSRAYDNVSNYEDAPSGSSDTLCGYDINSSKATIATPENGEYYKTMNTISGSCNDTGSGIYSVNITIYNVSANKYWSGGWVAGVSWLTATSYTGSPWTSWSYTSSAVTWMNNTQYIVNATARDNATNVGATDHNTFYYDTFGPVATIGVPINNKYYKTMTTISGDCEDDAGAGINSVNITIYNVTGNSYWTGAAWGSSTWLSTTLSGSPYDSWSYPSSTVSWMNASTYIVNATAVDNASNVGVADHNTFYYDTYGPPATIGVPSHGSYRKTLTQVSGSIVSDPAGVSTVNFTIYNVTGHKYWSGTSWVAGVSWLNTNLSGSPWNVWSNNTLAVSWMNASTYIVNATAVDNASNVGVADHNTFYYDTYNPTATITDPVSGDYYETLNTIYGDCSDSFSGIYSVNITIYNVTGNSYWTGAGWGSSTWLSTTLSGSPYGSWSYPSSTVSWMNGTTYYVNATPKDNASNVGTADSNLLYFDTGGPVISNVIITDTTIGSTTYVKDTDNVQIRAQVQDANLANGETSYIEADLTGFSGYGAAVDSSGYNGTIAWWNLTSVTCVIGNGTVTVTINASDKAGNYANEVTDTITADNAPPTLSYAVMDADNDGTNYSYVDVYFSESTMNTSTILYTDFNISRSGVGVAAIQTKSGNLVTLRFNTTFQTGNLPPIGIAGSVEDLAGNQLNSGTKTINTYRISLRSGWNLISLPADASGSLISDVVSNISSNVDKIWHYWGASNDTWSMWADSDDDVLFRLEPGESYWIDMDAADTLIGNYNLMPTGPNSPPTFTLKNQSWNLIGHWHTYNITASTDTYGVFSGFSDVDIGCIYKYTGTGYTDIWSYHKDMEPGQGYWMFLASTVDRVYTP